MSDLSLSETVHRLMHAYRYLLRKGIREQQVDLSITHIRTLKGIRRNPRSTAQSIAQRLQRDKAQITRALNALIDDGLIIKMDHPLDRRSQLLQLTTKGEKVMIRLDEAETWAIQQLTRDLPSDELTLFLRTCQAMADNAEQIAATEEGEI